MLSLPTPVLSFFCSPRFRIRLIGVSLAVASLSTAQSQTREVRPNIVFIVADDCGYGDLSCYGRQDYQTAALDRLAAEGVRFSQAYAAAPVCSPTRVGFMTGRYPARTPAGLREPLTGNNRAIGLTADHPTVSSLLKANGYETALVGKWHAGAQPEHHPNRHGFDEFFGIIEGATDYISHVNPLGRPDLFHNATPIKRDGYLTDLLTEQAVAFIARPRARPFFLSLQYTAPHWPWQGPGDAPYPIRPEQPAANAAAASPAPGNPPPRGAAAVWQTGGSAKTYATMMQRLDEGIAAVLSALEKAGLRENTLVIFTSDNGGEQFSNMDPFSGKKMELWEGGIRVPAMMRWPGVLAAGRTTDQVAVTMDWSATILAAARVQPAAGYALDGIDLLPICRGDTPVQSRTLAWRTFQRTRHKALRHGEWKYLHDGETEYLFDLTRDPGERRDRKAADPERFDELKKLHRAWETQMLAPVPLEVTAPPPAPDAKAERAAF
jgi:arylsulfatase A-like enzyme